jgi:PD-(D/E)XK nuclease superfamily protein
MTIELSTDQKGAIAESAIAHAAIKLGVSVSKPLADGERYDLIFDLHDRLVRVQCKWANLVGDVIAARCYSCRRTRDGQLKRGYSAEEIDAVALYCSELDRCFFFPVDWLSGRATIQLRLGPTRNNQQTGINCAEDFAFERLQSGLLGP